MKNQTKIMREIKLGGKVEIKRAEGTEEAPSRVIRGRAIVFNQPTEMWRDEERVVREVIAPEAITDEVLAQSDIKMTMHHNPEKVLARSKRGEGTLSYTRSEEGVDFEFEAPNTEDGNTALELVKRGDIDGCSFWGFLPEDAVDYTHTEEDGVKVTTCTIRSIVNLVDFTLTPSPAYEQTSVEAVKRSVPVWNDKEEAPITDFSESWDAILRESERY